VNGSPLLLIISSAATRAVELNKYGINMLSYTSIEFEWMNERMNERMNKWKNEWKNERMNERVNEWKNEWMDEWINEWVSEWTLNRWMDK